MPFSRSIRSRYAARQFDRREPLRGDQRRRLGDRQKAGIGRCHDRRSVGGGHENMRRLGLHRVIGPDQRDHLAQRGIGREQGALLARQQFEPEQFGFGGELRRNVDCHGRYSAALAIGRRFPPQQRDHLIGRADLGEHHHETRERRVMLFVGPAGIRVRNEEDLIVKHHGISRRRLAADIRGGADDDQRVDIARAQQRVEIGSALHERAKAVFAHDRVPGLDVKFGVKRMAEVAGRKCAPHARAPFCIGEIVEVNGPRFVALRRWSCFGSTPQYRQKRGLRPRGS